MSVPTGGSERLGEPSSEQLWPVEAYLDRLFDLLAGSGPAGRRALAEVEDHLRTASASGVAAGLSRLAAEQAAVDRFGPVDQVARRLVTVAGRAGLPVIARQVVAAGWLLGGIGLVSIGVSGLLSWWVAAAFGADLIAPDRPDEPLSGYRCAYLLAGYPGAGSCHQASVIHHAEELVRNGLAAGVLGLLALVAFWLSRRGGRLRPLTVTPPTGIVAAAGATAFGVAGLVLVGSAVSRLHAGERWGAGWSLVAGLSALPAFVLFVAVLLRELRQAAVR